MLHISKHFQMKGLNHLWFLSQMVVCVQTYRHMQENTYIHPSTKVMTSSTSNSAIKKIEQQSHQVLKQKTGTKVKVAKLC